MAGLTGLICPNLTPFNPDLSIATDLYLEHAKRMLDAGCSALAPFGTTGEALSVGMDERMSVLEAMVGAGIDPAQVVPGTGLTNLQDTAKLCRHAIEMKCAGVMVLPPFYYKGVSDEALFEYFSALIGTVDSPELRIYLYHIPPVAQVPVSVELTKRLADAFPGTIVGIKDSSGDWDNTQRLLTEVKSIAVFPGSKNPLVDASRWARRAASAPRRTSTRRISSAATRQPARRKATACRSRSEPTACRSRIWARSRRRSGCSRIRRTSRAGRSSARR